MKVWSCIILTIGILLSGVATIDANLLTDGDFEANNFVNTGWTAGTSPTDVWTVRAIGSAGQETDYLLSADPNILHYVEPGGSGPGALQGIVYPGAVTVTMSFDHYRDVLCQIYGANTGEAQDQWGAGNDFAALLHTISISEATGTEKTRQRRVSISATNTPRRRPTRGKYGTMR